DVNVEKHLDAIADKAEWNQQQVGMSLLFEDFEGFLNGRAEPWVGSRTLALESETVVLRLDLVSYQLHRCLELLRILVSGYQDAGRQRVRGEQERHIGPFLAGEMVFKRSGDFCGDSVD